MNEYYSPQVIEDTPFPNAVVGEVISSNQGAYSPQTIPDVKPKRTLIARNVINSSINTQAQKILGSYTFAEMGAIRIGKRVAGVSGEISISPTGILGINAAGDTTFSIDGDTGDATFKGTIAAGSVIAAAIAANLLTIDGTSTFASGYNPTTKVAMAGGNYASAASGARVLIFPDANTGIQIIDDGGADVFKALVGGADVGDIIIGDYAGSKGLMWDKSAGVFYVKGRISTNTGSTLNAGYLSSGDVPKDRMSANVLDALKVNVSELSAITANIGTITAGSITGVTITSANSNSKVVLNSGNYIEFYSGGVLKGRVRGGYNSGMVADVGSYVTKVDEGFYACVDSSFSDFFKFFCTDVAGTVSGVIEAPNSNKIYITDASGNTLFSFSTTQAYSSKKLLVDDGLQFGTSGNSSSNGKLWYYDGGGGSYYFRSRNGSWNGQFDQTGF